MSYLYVFEEYFLVGTLIDNIIPSAGFDALGTAAAWTVIRFGVGVDLPDDVLVGTCSASDPLASTHQPG